MCNMMNIKENGHTNIDSSSQQGTPCSILITLKAVYSEKLRCRCHQMLPPTVLSNETLVCAYAIMLHNSSFNFDSQ